MRGSWSGVVGGPWRGAAGPEDCRAARCRRYAGPTMSTRKLILAALLCGMAILLAFTLQLVLLPS